jgi:hypothetical protein
VAHALDRPWDRLAELTVCVAPQLVCRVELPDTGETVHVTVDAGIDWASGTLYVRDRAALTRPSGAGRAVAARFPGKRREVAHAWGDACDQAEQGRTAVRLSLADDRVRRDQEAAQAEVDRRLREFEAGVEERRAGGGKRAGAAAGAPVPPVLTAPPAVSPARGPVDPTAPTVPAAPPRRLVDPGALRLAGTGGRVTPPGSPAPGAPGARPAGTASVPPVLPPPRPGSAVPQQHTPPRPYTTADQEKVALDLVRHALAGDQEWLRDLRAQHGLGADAVDGLERFYELKAYGGAEPDAVQLTPAEFRRATESDDFFLVVVSCLEAGTGPVSVRIVPQPLQQLTWRTSGNVTVSGVRGAQSLVYRFEEEA